MSREAIAREMLPDMFSSPRGDRFFATCPFQHLHTGKNGPRDFMVVLTGAPTAFCLHKSCSLEVADFNRKLRREIWIAEQPSGSRTIERYNRDVAPLPRGERTVNHPVLDMERVKKVVARCRVEPSRAWLSSVSPIAPSTVTHEVFFESLYDEGEKVLIFTSEYSQGDFAFWVGKGSFRLGKSPSVRAVPSPLPLGGERGVWFLTNPVSGKWEKKRHMGPDGMPLSRRSETAVTSWRYLVLESDDLPEHEWLAIVSQLAVPVSALYTSGGKSIHALVRVDCKAKTQFDALRDSVRQLLAPLGADPAAMSAVRLSRLPGMLRGDKMQELLFLNPDPEERELQTLMPLRSG